MRAMVAAVVVLSVTACVCERGETDANQPRDAGAQLDSGVRDAGIHQSFDAGPPPEPEPHIPINECDWDERGSLDAGANPVWAFRGPDCIRISGHDAGEPGVFATLEECEQTCPCVPSKFQNVPGYAEYPHCEVVRIVPDAGDIQDRWIESAHVTPGQMAELCQLSFDAGVSVMTCWHWE